MTKTKPLVVAPTYRYAATVERVIDGDTIVVSVDLGFRLAWSTPVRLYGVNAPEIGTLAGKQSLNYTARWLREAARVVIESAHPGRAGDKYGRWLARVFNAETGACLNDDMLLAAMAVVMDD